MGLWDEVVKAKYGPVGTSPAQQAKSAADDVARYQYELARMQSLMGMSAFSPFASPISAVAPPVNAPEFLATIEKLKTAEPYMVSRPMPDYIQPVVSWRAWSVKDLKLVALGQGDVWEPKQPMEAKCKGGATGHRAPSKSCKCGVWGFNTLPTLIDALPGYNNKHVLGMVSMWGRMIQCENGWRAQFAYPKELWLLDKEHEQLGFIYGVPVRIAAVEPATDLSQAGQSTTT